MSFWLMQVIVNRNFHWNIFKRRTDFREKVTINSLLKSSWASQLALVVKNPPANAGDIKDAGSFPGSGRSHGKGHGNSLQYSFLKNRMDRGARQAAVHGVVKSRTQLKRFSTSTNGFSVMLGEGYSSGNHECAWPCPKLQQKETTRIYPAYWSCLKTVPPTLAVSSADGGRARYSQGRGLFTCYSVPSTGAGEVWHLVAIVSSATLEVGCPHFALAHDDKQEWQGLSCVQPEQNNSSLMETWENLRELTL